MAMAVRSASEHNRRLLNELEVGDCIEFDRGLYSHWGIYIGEGEVIHLTGDPADLVSNISTSASVFTICGVQFQKAKVVIEDFFQVCGKSRAKKNNAKDSEIEPFDKEKILKNAKSKLGKISYNVLWSNCEHFANWCRYGKQVSDQTDTAVALGITTAVISAAGAAYYFSESKKTERN